MEWVGKKITLYKERNEQQRQEFLQEIANLNPDDIVWADESGIDEILYRSYARGPKKSRIYGEKTGKYVSRTSLIGAYNQHIMKAPFRFQGYTNTAIFNCWVKKCLLPELKPGQTIIIDNASIHKSPKTKELIESVGCKLLYQPPYSPDLNKIEPMWANLKNRLRNYYEPSISFFHNLDAALCEFSNC